MTARLSRFHSGLVGTLALLAAPPCASAAPCIDLGGGRSLVQRTMAIEAHGADVLIDRATISFYPATRQVGVRVEGVAGEQRFTSLQLRLGTLRPNPAAQMAQPAATPLGPVSLDVPLTQIAIVDGILRYPGCANASADHQVGFDGALTFGQRKLKVEGTFTDYAPPKIGGASPASSVGAKPGP